MGETIYKNGLPYAPDIRRLDDAFPTPQEGQILRYEQIAEILNHEMVDSRLRQVMLVWRRALLKTRNIDSAAVPGIGIKILEPAERAQRHEKGILSKSRQVRIERQRYAATPRERLNTEGQQRYDHVMLLTGRIQAAIDDVKKQLPADIAPVKSLPKPKLVKNGT